MKAWYPRLIRQFDAFLFESCSPATCVLLRMVFAGLLIVYVSAWWLNAELWFSSAGVLQSDTAKSLSQGPFWSLFFWLSDTPLTITICLTIMSVQILGLLLGIGSRFQAICLFFWLVSFQSRNPLIGDCEDYAFRMFAFCLMFMPLDHAYSLGKTWSLGTIGWPFRTAATALPAVSQAWGLRLLQIHLTLVYASAAASKWLGSAWRDGSALFYVFQMEDLYGRGPLPGFILESDSLIRITTWSVLVLEAALPFALWYRRTRLLAVVLGIGLHLSMEYAMHLFLFQWIMIASLLSFLQLPSRPTNQRTTALEGDHARVP